METERKPLVTPGLVVGMLILAAGVILMLDHHGIIDAHHAFAYFWPVVLTCAGLLKFVTSRHPVGKFWGFILGALGIVLVLDRAGYIHFHWADVWPFFIIAVGLIMVWSAIERRRSGAPHGSHANLNEWTAFGGGELVNDSKNFQGGEVFAIFGGYEIDLRDAKIQGPEAIVYASAMFGGIEMKIPENWRVVLHGIPLLGGYSDKTRHPKVDSEAEEKRLIVKGFAMFGGVEVKN